MSSYLQTVLYSETPESITGLINFLETEKADLSEIESNAWDHLRGFDFASAPLPSNVMISFLYRAVETILTEKYASFDLEISYDVNSIGSSFTVNHTDIQNLEQLLGFIEDEGDTAD